MATFLGHSAAQFDVQLHCRADIDRYGAVLVTLTLDPQLESDITSQNWQERSPPAVFATNYARVGDLGAVVTSAPTETCGWSLAAPTFVNGRGSS